MAVGLVDTKGKELTNQQPNVRNYSSRACFHGGAFAAKGKGHLSAGAQPADAQRDSPRLIVDMDEWVSKGTEPPASRVPSANKGTLVSPLPQEEEGIPRRFGHHL